MPTLSIYIKDEIYQHMAKIGKAPSAVGKAWIEKEYNRQKGEKQ